MDSNKVSFRYEAAYAKDIPEVISGDAFLEKYGDHNDTVTVIDPKRSYSVKAPTRHPIYENFRVEVKSPPYYLFLH
jgi:L-arabinokinase